MPGVGDSDILHIDSKTPGHTIFMKDKADNEGLRQLTVSSVRLFLNKSLEGVDYKDFMNNILKLQNRNVPNKLSRSRNINPWMNTGIRRLFRRRDRTHSNTRFPGKERDWARYKSVKRKAQCKFRRAAD